MIKKVIKTICLFFEWLYIKTIGNRRLVNHFTEFPYIYALLLAMFAIALFVAPSNWTGTIRLFGVVLALLTALVLIRPMNAVYGLMGTSGSIRLFFFNFLFITALFAGVYYFTFFKDAGISYDINQPHIDYNLFADEGVDCKIRVLEKRDTLCVEHQLDTISFKETILHVTRDTLHYQKITFPQVWRSSILTTLTQESADLFSIAAVHNVGIESSNVGLDKQKSSLFEWILIFHIIISWIFFGVFISLLYNKFRHES